MFEPHKISLEQSQTLVSVAIPLNLISMFSNLLVILIFMIFLNFKSHLVNRVSLRLTFAVAIVNFFYSTFQIVSDVSQESGILCGLSVWGYIQTSHLSTFLTVMIAFNVQVIFIHGKRQTQTYEKYYFSISVLLSLAISLPPLLSGRLGHDLYQESCWYSIYEASERILWTWATLYCWTMLGVFYCCIVVVLVMIKITRERQRRKKFLTSDSIATRSTMNKVVRRVILYPVIPVLSQTFNLISELDIYWNKRVDYTYLLLSFIGTSSQGILNAMLFFIDPAIQNAWSELKDDLILNYHFRCETFRPIVLDGSLKVEHPKTASILNFLVKKVLLSRADATRLSHKDESMDLRCFTVEPLKKAILHQSNRYTSSFVLCHDSLPKSSTSNPPKASLNTGLDFSGINLIQEAISIYHCQDTEYDGENQFICYM
ncbi:hypothetical protein K7432_007239 [Basidiobolus ranarum]|uniref:G-protein coupled receptors family 2 profile 2 domain-containing protein n=1 Tax=Basidiobolus ranarum TaxID=34480 RepID=A0ABR2W0F4_9FUNG